MARWFTEVRTRGIGVRATVLAASLTLVYAAVAPVAFALGGGWALCVSALAAVVCLTGATVALVVSHLLRAPKRMLLGLLLAVGARMGIPLIFGLGVHLSDGALARGGFLCYLLVFFPAALAVETGLSLPMPDRAKRCTKAS
jgi:hypothetical protein